MCLLPFSVKSLCICACPQSFRRRPRQNSGGRREELGEAQATAEKGERARCPKRRPCGAVPYPDPRHRRTRRYAGAVPRRRSVRVSADSSPKGAAARSAGAAPAAGRNAGQKSTPQRRLTQGCVTGKCGASQIGAASAPGGNAGAPRRGAGGGVFAAAGPLRFGDGGHQSGCRDFLRVWQVAAIWADGSPAALMAARELGGVRRTVCAGRAAARPRARDGAGRSRQHPRHGRHNPCGGHTPPRVSRRAKARTAHVSRDVPRYCAGLIIDEGGRVMLGTDARASGSPPPGVGRHQPHAPAGGGCGAGPEAERRAGSAACGADRVAYRKGAAPLSKR